MKYKMVCIDMDGTLLGKKRKISKYSKDIIKKAHDMGVEIVVTTGRLYNNAAYFSHILGVESPVIAANGAIVIDKRNNNIIYEESIPKKECLQILNILRKYKTPFHVHTTDTIFCNNWISKTGTQLYMTKQKYVEGLHIHYYTIKSLSEWERVFTENNGKIAKYIALNFSKEKMKKIKKEISEIKSLVCYSSGGHSLEINYRGVSKGNAVKVLAHKYGVKREEIICIGDNENDISMIKFAGVGIAMENAIDEVKNISNYITQSNKDDGVAKAIEKFILNYD